MITQNTIQNQHCGLWHCPVEKAGQLMPELQPIFDSCPIQDGTIDVKIHMLMPNQYPCIPNWHYDLVPRDKGLNQLFDKCDTNKKMYLLVSGTPIPEFKDGREVKPWNWIEFTQLDLHRGTISKSHQWRLFARVVPKEILSPASSEKWIRRHCQVYLDTENFKW